MNIEHINFIDRLQPTSIDKKVDTSRIDSNFNQLVNRTSFSNILDQSLKSLENKQIQSSIATKDLITGEADNLHNVMIQATEAQLSLELAVQLRNRCLEAVNEIKNMQF